MCTEFIFLISDSNCPKELFVKGPSGDNFIGKYEIAFYKVNGKNYWAKSDGMHFITYDKYWKITQYKVDGERFRAPTSSDNLCPNEVPKSSWQVFEDKTWNEWNEFFPLISIWYGKFRHW